MGTFGFEYREESLSREVDDTSDQFLFRIVNAQPLEGEFDVTEAFGEFALPLVENRLDLNAAVRWADYSTVGTTVSWKTGLTFEPIDSLRFRATVSEDIRAAAIGEAFLETLLLFADITNPFTGNQDFIEVLNTGNSNLSEERATTTTVGLIWSPTDIDFQVSVDWYNIDLEDSISQLSSQQIVDRCFAGDQSLCDNVNFAPDQTVLQVTNQFLNLGTFEVEGFDIEATYGIELGPGDLNINLLASIIDKKLVAPQGGTPVDYAGEVGFNSGFGTPDLKVRAGANYAVGDWSVYGQLRFIGDGKYDVTWGPEQLADSENNIGSETYLDLSGRYRFSWGPAEDVEIYLGINNVLDNDPPVIPLDFISNLATNAGIYDVVGRSYYAGVRMAF